jgi:hypothetical protein
LEFDDCTIFKFASTKMHAELLDVTYRTTEK